MPSLHEVQHAIRLSLVERDDRAAAAYIGGDGLAPSSVCLSIAIRSSAI
jgi:hypothetical protein